MPHDSYLHHVAADAGLELQRWEYSKAANKAALDLITGRSGEIYTTTDTGVDYFWNAVAGLWETWKSAHVYAYLKTALGVTAADLTADATNGRITVGDAVVVNSYYQDGTVGGGTYEVVAAATGTDDGGSYIDVGTVQLKAGFHKNVPVTRFGATSAGNSTAAVNAARAVALALDLPVYWPGLGGAAFYTIDTIQLNSGEQWIGGGISNSLIRVRASQDGLELNDRIHLQDFEIFAAFSRTGKGLFTSGPAAGAARFSATNIRVRGFDVGIDLTGTQIALWTNCYVTSSNTGVLFGDTAIRSKFVGGEISGALVAGCEVEYSVGHTLDNVAVEANPGGGINFTGNLHKAAFRIHDCHFEHNPGGHITIRDAGTKSVSALSIKGNWFSRAAEAIVITPDLGSDQTNALGNHGHVAGCEGAEISGNVFRGGVSGTPDVPMVPIQIGRGAENTVIGPNIFHQYQGGTTMFDPEVHDDGQNTMYWVDSLPAVLETAVRHYHGKDYENGSASWTCRMSGQVAAVNGTQTKTGDALAFNGTTDFAVLDVGSSPSLGPTDEATIIIRAQMANLLGVQALFDNRTGTSNAVDTGFAVLADPNPRLRIVGLNASGVTLSGNIPDLTTALQTFGAVVTTERFEIHSLARHTRERGATGVDVDFHGSLGYYFGGAPRTANPFTSTVGWTVGRRAQASVEFAEMSVYDVIVFDRALTVAELIRLEEELLRVPISPLGNRGPNSGTTPDRPTLAAGDAGYEYFDTNLVHPIWWTGTGWVDSNGAAV